MFNTPEKITAASKHSFQAQMTLLHEVGEKILESGHKLLSLHVQTSKKLLEDGKASANQLLNSKSPLEFWSQRSQQFRPAIDHILQYETQFAKILTEAQTELLSCSLKEAITLQDGLANLNTHAKAEPHPAEPKAAVKAASPVKTSEVQAAAKVSETKPAAKVSTKPAAAAKVESKNAVKATAKPAVKAKPTVKAKPAVKAKPILTAVPTSPQVTEPQAEPQVAHQAAPPEVHATPAVESAVPHIDEQAKTSVEPPQAN